MGRKFILWFVLLIVGFLTGFLLQYARLQRAQQELSASTKQLGSCQSSPNFSPLGRGGMNFVGMVSCEIVREVGLRS